LRRIAPADEACTIAAMTEPTKERQRPHGVLFVCLGNICRSPLAEGIFLHLARERGVADRFRVDSAGTGGWHAGEGADPRSVAVGGKNGVHLPSIARRIDPDNDFADPESGGFDTIIAMDRANHRDLLDEGAPSDRVFLMRSFDATAADRAEVPDPYYGGDRGFDDVFDMLSRASAGLLDHLLKRAER
jgi:protein-tyrosine phosphatase